MNLFKEYQLQIESLLQTLEKKTIIKLPLNLNSLTLQLPPKKQKGHVASNVALLLSKINNEKPITLANLLKTEMENNFSEIESIEIASPGFLNLSFKINFWEKLLFEIIKNKKIYGKNSTIKKNYNVEFVSANPTGPLHVGHCRGAILGDVISNLLIFNGHSVVKEYYVNDYGVQIKNFVSSIYFRIVEILEKKPFPKNKDLYPGDYIIDIAKEIIKKKSIVNYNNFDNIFETLSSESLKLSMNMIKKNLSSLGVSHDSFINESDLITKNIVSKTIKRLQESNHVYEGTLKPPKGDDASMWKSRSQILFKSTEFGDDTDRALQKQDKSWTYFAGDIAYHSDKIDRNFDALINILGADHAGYIKRITAAVSALSKNKVNLQCKVSQLVKLYKDNKPFKMSKRKGDYITVDDLIKEVGRDSVRFMMLNRSNDVELDFDFKKVTEKSKENPVFYVQYAYARINSIFKALNLNLNDNIELKDEKFSLNSHEIEIMKKISEWPKCVEISLFKLEPHIITFYLYELSTLFHSYWNMGNENKNFRFIIDNKPVKNSRLIILQALATVISNGMFILGVSTPSSM